MELHGYIGSLVQLCFTTCWMRLAMQPFPLLCRLRSVSSLDTWGMAIALVCQESQMVTGHVYIAAVAFPLDQDGDITSTHADNPGLDCALLEDVLTSHAHNETWHRDEYAGMIVTDFCKATGKVAAAFGCIVRKEKDGCYIFSIVEKKIIRLAEDGLGKTYEDVQCVQKSWTKVMSSIQVFLWLEPALIWMCSKVLWQAKLRVIPRNE